MTKQFIERTHDDVMEDIKKLKRFIDETLEYDSIGDMLNYLTDHGYKFILGNPDQTESQRIDDEQALRDKWRFATLEQIGYLWTEARQTYEKEIKNYERS